ncbi:MAG: Hint domain-containing protein [archaeon]
MTEVKAELWVYDTIDREYYLDVINLGDLNAQEVESVQFYYDQFTDDRVYDLTLHVEGVDSVRGDDPRRSIMFSVSVGDVPECSDKIDNPYFGRPNGNERCDERDSNCLIGEDGDPYCDGSDDLLEGLTCSNEEKVEGCRIYKMRYDCEADLCNVKNYLSLRDACVWKGMDGCGLPEIQCFDEGTKIKMFDGTEKYIEDVEEGDSVLSYDLESGMNVEGVVEKVFVHDYAGELLEIAGMGVTPEHPVFVNGDWVEAGEIVVGDRLSDVEVKSVEENHFEGNVYNLHVGKFRIIMPKEILCITSHLWGLSRKGCLVLL